MRTIQAPVTTLFSRPAAALLLGATLASTGCMFNDIRHDRLALQGFVEVSARVEISDWNGAPLVLKVGRVGDDAGGAVVPGSTIRTLDEPRALSFMLGPGRYVIGAFEDQNANGRHDRGERAVSSQPFEVAAGAALDEFVLTLSADPGEGESLEAADAIARAESHPYYALGEVAPLTDERFGPKYGRLGMWEPSKYALEHRPGVYMLEPHDPERTPVLFVHGMAGCPQEFGPLIDSLDETRFEAWVFMYPSGYPLDEIADFLHRVVVELEAEYAYPRLCVVGHSMGGLVARGFLADYAQAGRDQRVFGLATIASPLDGVPAAARAVKRAPEVVPSWYDLAPGSAYSRRIYREPLDDQIEYHLLYAFEGDGQSDGVVPVASQLRAEARAEAEVLRGYRASHTEILESPAAAAQVMAMLDRCRRQAGP